MLHCMHRSRIQWHADRAYKHDLRRDQPTATTRVLAGAAAGLAVGALAALRSLPTCVLAAAAPLPSRGKSGLGLGLVSGSGLGTRPSGQLDPSPAGRGGQVGRRWPFGRMLLWPPLYLAVQVVLGLRGSCALMFAHGDVLAGWGPVCIPVSAHVHCRHLRHGPGVALRTLRQERRAHLVRPCMHTGILRVCGWPCGPSVLPGMPFG